MRNVDSRVQCRKSVAFKDASPVVTKKWGRSRGRRQLVGFYLRKSFRLGPFRFNLSKSGVGTSVGVKGARVGVDGRGKGYVAGGRGGLFFRKQLPTANDESSTRTSSSGYWIAWLAAAAIVGLVIAVLAGCRTL
jgi:hypothetical protein